MLSILLSVVVLSARADFLENIWRLKLFRENHENWRKFKKKNSRTKTVKIGSHQLTYSHWLQREELKLSAPGFTELFVEHLSRTKWTFSYIKWWKCEMIWRWSLKFPSRRPLSPFRDFFGQRFYYKVNQCQETFCATNVTERRKNIFFWLWELFTGTRSVLPKVKSISSPSFPFSVEIFPAFFSN